MSDLNERVAVLESQVVGIDGLRTEIRSLHDEITRYKGFIGGVTFVFGCVVTFIGFGKDWLLGHWK